MTNAEIAANLVRTIRNQNYRISDSAADMLRLAIEAALATAERQGMRRAAELCRTWARTAWTLHVRENIARQIERLIAEEQANG